MTTVLVAKPPEAAWQLHTAAASSLSGIFAGMRSCWTSVTGPVQRSDDSDRGCPLGTVIDPPIWHASGTAGENETTIGGVGVVSACVG
jgi:hypothetical protein